MSIRVLPDGTIEGVTVAEALEIQREIRLRGAPVVNAATPPKGFIPPASRAVTPDAAKAILSDFKEWVLPSALEFLTAIQGSPKPGATAEVMMRALGIDDPKAFGGRTASINKLIASAGFKVDLVYDATRTSAGRFWVPGWEIGRAIAHLKTLKAAQH